MKKVTKVKGLVVEMLICERVNVSSCGFKSYFCKNNLVENPLVSIIVPVYKVEAYIGRCLNSIAAQAYPNIECILVDDASPDQSLAIAEDFLKKSHVKYKILKQLKNKGLSEARNSGVKNATGKYLYFLDSDDEMTPMAIEHLVNLAEQTQAEITVGQNLVIRENGKRAYIFKTKEERECVSGNADVLQSYVNGQYPVMACDKLLSAEFIKKKQLFFEPGLLSEDELWSFQCALKLQKIAFWKGEETYLYYFRDGSIIKSKGKKHFDSFQKIAEKFDEAYHSEKDPDIRRMILMHLINFKDMSLVMNWQAQFNEELWKESYRNFQKLSTLSLFDYFSKQYSISIKKKSLYTSLPVNLGYHLFRKRYGA